MTPLETKLPIELFHRMYVVSKLSLSLIATLHNTSRVTLTELRDKYIAMGHPLSHEIADTDNTGYYPRFMGDLMQLISKEDLCRELRTKTIYEIAAQYKLIAPTVNSHTPLSKEWLKAELMTKSVKQIASETNMSVSRLYVIISEYGLSEATRTFHIDPNILRELFINRCWSDETIAEHLQVIMENLQKRGLLIIDATGEDGIDKINIPGLARRKADIVIDTQFVRKSIDEQLKRAEIIAKNNGSVLIAATPKPVVLHALKDWVETFSPQLTYEQMKEQQTAPEKPLVLVPVSNLVVE